MEDNVKKYLDKVIEQLVSETTIDYAKERLYTPFSPSWSSFSSPLLHQTYTSLPFTSPNFPFAKHCIEVYGLNKEETEYVWSTWKYIIRDKIGWERNI